MTSMRLLVTFALAFGLVAGVGGCAIVPAHRRGRLAHRSMAADGGRSLAREHVLAIQEGATGGATEMASGCGCN